MATLSLRLALRGALQTLTALALCTPTFAQSADVPQPPPPEMQPARPPTEMHRVEVGSRIVPGQPHGPGANFQTSIRQVTGKPYSLILESEQNQTLTDGTKISRKTTIQREYRDSMGRTRTEREPVPPPGQEMTAYPIIQLADPVARYQYTLNTRAKTVRRVSARVFASPPIPAGRPSPLTLAHAVTTIPPAANQDHPRPAMQREQLGTQTFDGIEAEGIRMTTTYPVGYMGNDRPIETVCEHWTSRELQTTVMSKCFDPRSGETTTRLTHAELSEPDPALFRPPADFKLLKEPGQEQPWYKRLHL